MSAEPCLRVMLVEDSTDDVYFMQYALNRSQTPVDTAVAQSVREALDLLRDDALGKTDLMLLDLNLPGASGFELLYTFQNEPALRPAHVAVMTSSTLEEDRILASDLGADGFLTKPTRFEELVGMLDKLLTKLTQGS